MDSQLSTLAQHQIGPSKSAYTGISIHSPLVNTHSTMGSIIIVNASSAVIGAFVSKYSEGSDDWYNLNANARDSWARNGWEMVGFRNADDTQRGGLYVPANSMVIFHSFEHIEVK